MAVGDYLLFLTIHLCTFNRIRMIIFKGIFKSGFVDRETGVISALTPADFSQVVPVFLSENIRGIMVYWRHERFFRKSLQKHCLVVRRFSCLLDCCSHQFYGFVKGFRCLFHARSYRLFSFPRAPDELNFVLGFKSGLYPRMCTD